MCSQAWVDSPSARTLRCGSDGNASLTHPDNLARIGETWASARLRTAPHVLWSLTQNAGACANNRTVVLFKAERALCKLSRSAKARSFGGSTYWGTTATRLLPSRGFSTTSRSVNTRRTHSAPTPMTSGICSSFWLLRDWNGRRFDQPMLYGSCLFCGGGRANAQHSGWGSV